MNKIKNFNITMGKGFRMMFSNGYGISVQWGPGNYCDNYNDNFSDFFESKERHSLYSCNDCEIALFSGEEMIDIPWYSSDQVIGRVSSDTVGRLIGWLQSCPKNLTLEKWHKRNPFEM